MTHVDWKPYPKYKPKKDGEYLITILFRTGDRYAISSYWLCNGGEGKWVHDLGERTIAWADMPKPYKGEGAC